MSSSSLGGGELYEIAGFAPVWRSVARVRVSGGVVVVLGRRRRLGAEPGQ
jgi:hypothetical protein